ncbi:MAG: class A beta-lactamase-related serine hydrolase [Winogradskyella sp.]|uniref:serine hydrolase domain-containing protein n=1 Tax=Winogradskyella sp. TaxID=1883156 RepID=UPI000F3C9F4A|nr:serine hydrolase domain-containing protein [Winogradskyella sp.]RNC88345.1 MAG: class A beta-lactamase-related serine hydrolase [Winogradskyella sp.]
MKKIVLLCIGFIGLSSYAQMPLKQVVDSIVESKLKETHPGIAVGIIKDGEIIYETYRGLSNLQHQVKFNAATRSNIASTAKQFTALMVLDLALNKKLNLDHDIRKYLPSLYPNVKESIKIRHLINHTSGIRDYVELLDMVGDVWWRRFGLDNDDIMELLEKQHTIGFKPGSAYSYSNSNYNVLTKIIENVTNTSFNDYSKAFFKDLGMNETSFVERYMRVIPNRANPYSDWGRGEWWEVPTVTKTNGEGFLFTTLKDQLIYEQAVQNATLNNNLLLIKSQQPIENSEIKTYGFGLELEDKLGRTSVHHSGGTYGFHSQTYRFPEERLTIFIMSNNGNISSNLIAQEIAKLLFIKPPKAPKYDNRFYETNESVKSGVIFGNYTYPNENSVVNIYEKDGQLFWKEKNFTIEMVLDSDNIYSFTNNPKLKVVFYKDEMVEFYPSGKTMAYKRRAQSMVSQTDLDGLVGNYYSNELDLSFKIKLTEENELNLKLSGDNEYSNIVVYNESYMLANNYFLKIHRDELDQVTNISLTYGRALNIPFKKIAP